MSWVAKDLPSLIFLLLPGFLASGIYYTLTPHPKTTEFERVVQALIFTVILKGATSAFKPVLFYLAKYGSLGKWGVDGDLTCALLIAIPVGTGFAVISNKDYFHAAVRRLGWTARTSYPSEWYGAFVREKRWVVLHLSDGRRLYGWPDEWPDQADRGHFVIGHPEWLLDDNNRAILHQVEKVMVQASDVKMIEFMKNTEEISATSEDLDRIREMLVRLQGGPEHGSESTAAGPESPGPDPSY